MVWCMLSDLVTASLPIEHYFVTYWHRNRAATSLFFRNWGLCCGDNNFRIAWRCGFGLWSVLVDKSADSNCIQPVCRHEATNWCRYVVLTVNKYVRKGMWDY